MSNRINLAWIVLVGVAFGFSGCASLSSLGNGTVPTSAPSAGQYLVEMSGGYGKPSTYTGELDGPLTVQTALERSGATKKFRNMDVTILRVVEDTGRPLKMSVRFDSSKKSITPEQDYALLPGDRIQVEAVTVNFIDKMVESVSGK